MSLYCHIFIHTNHPSVMLSLFASPLPVPGLECIAGPLKKIALHDHTIGCIHVEFQLWIIVRKILWGEHIVCTRAVLEAFECSMNLPQTNVQYYKVSWIHLRLWLSKTNTTLTVKSDRHHPFKPMNHYQFYDARQHNHHAQCPLKESLVAVIIPLVHACLKVFFPETTPLHAMQGKIHSPRSV